jgi:SAM-dependent methyltransferase
MDPVRARTNWWENFFHGIALDFWRAAVSPEQTRAEADFIQKHLQLSQGAKVLDVPCGNGRLALELASRGFDLTGVDIASEFIEEAKAKSTASGVKVEWHNREMRDLPWQAVFDAAFCFGNSFGYLDNGGNRDFLEAVARVLKPGARLLMDAPAVAESLLPTFQERRWFEVGGITLLIDGRYDHEQARIFTEYTFIKNGKAEKRPSSQRIYTYSEIGQLLKEVGLKPDAAYGSLSEEAFKLGSQRLLLVAAKT